MKSSGQVFILHKYCKAGKPYLKISKLKENLWTLVNRFDAKHRKFHFPFRLFIFKRARVQDNFVNCVFLFLMSIINIQEEHSDSI